MTRPHGVDAIAMDANVDLYTVLGLEPYPAGKSATAADIKRAYYKQARCFHPDKQPADASAADKTQATRTFQLIGTAYAILSDASKRSKYDRTGRWTSSDLDASETESSDWDAYFRDLYGRVSLDDLKEFEREYKGSDEERCDLLAAYTRVRGDMNKIIEEVMLAHVDDEPRYREIIDAALKAGDIKPFAAYTKSVAPKERAKRRRAADREAMEAQELAEELGIDLNATSSSAAAAPRDSNSMLPDVDPNLQALIRGRNQSKFDSLIAGLEARYAAPAPKAGKRKRVAKK